MKHKLKVGDWFKHPTDNNIFEVVAVVEGTENYKGNWNGGYSWVTIHDSYVSKIVKSDNGFQIGVLMWTPFSSDDHLICIEKPVTVTIDMSRYNTTCIDCGSPAYQGLMTFECSNTNCPEKKK